MASLAERFRDLFSPNTNAYGCYYAVAASGDAKVEGRRWTEKSTLSIQQWERHLAGTDGFGLGCIPVRPDLTCRFGAIDVDVYPIDLTKLAADCVRLGIPAIVCRTKSGGAHLYVFFNEPAPAPLVHERLSAWATALGYGGSEIFPKQTESVDVGNWINIPYQAGERSTRYAIVNGKSLSPQEFLEHASASSVTVEGLEAIEIASSPSTVDDDFYEGPPCLQILNERGFPIGTRNNSLFNVAVYLRKRFVNDWADRLDGYNQRLFRENPLLPGEVSVIGKSATKKSYSYMCKTTPIAACCDRKTCMTREFGVGSGATTPGVEFGFLIKLETQPPSWLLEVNGIEVQLETDEFLNQQTFARKIVEELSILPNMMKASAWNKLVKALLEKVEIRAVPLEATVDGSWWGYLEQYCTGRSQGKTLDELLIGKPFTENGRTYFRVPALMSHYQQHRVNITEKKLYHLLRHRGVQDHQGPLKGKFTSYWSLPAFSKQTEPHTVPRSETGGAM